MQKRLVLGLYPGETLELLASDLNRYLRERMGVSHSFALEGNNVPFVNLFTGSVESDSLYLWDIINPVNRGEKLDSISIRPQIFEIADSGDIIIPVYGSDADITQLNEDVRTVLLPDIEDAGVQLLKNGGTVFRNYIKIGQLDDMSRRAEVNRNYHMLRETSAYSRMSFAPTGFYVEFGNKK